MRFVYRRLSGSFPTRGTWIETEISVTDIDFKMSFPTRGTWIETSTPSNMWLVALSFPTRGTWIETTLAFMRRHTVAVVPYAGNVD